MCDVFKNNRENHPGSQRNCVLKNRIVLSESHHRYCIIIILYLISRNLATVQYSCNIIFIVFSVILFFSNIRHVTEIP